MPRILITDKLAPEAITLLEQRGHEVALHVGAAPDSLPGLVRGAHGWIVRSGTQVTAADIEAADQLVVVGRAGVGVDNIDIAAATRAGVAVVNTPTGNTMAAVEHTLALLLSLVRHIPQAHASLAGGAWKRSQFVGVELYGKTIGVLGLGKIGARVATRCRGFEMTVLGYDPYVSPERAAELGVELIPDLDDLYGRCDFITLHLPNTPQTRGMINAEILAKLKPGARLINCARGALVDEAALAAALTEGRLAGAALDVFGSEPPDGSPILDAPNVILTPHLGASTVESQLNVGMQVAERVADAVERGVFRDAVNVPVRDWATYSKLKPQLLLVERLGRLAQQFVDTSLSEVRVTYRGASWGETAALDNALLMGLLASVSEGVNTVNAALLADERGIRLHSSVREDSADYQSTVEIELLIDGRQRTFVGTVFGDQAPRVVRLDGVPVEVILEGTLLMFVNMDRPGVIGRVGALCGQYEINIARFNLGRVGPGQSALAVLHLDSPMGAAQIDELATMEDMTWVRQIVLPS